MKKAKILVPAIAALVLSSAAAVTGTVAWFTSTRTATITSNAVTVVNASGGNLTATLAEGTGASVSGTTVTHGTLVDGSVDVSTPATVKVYELTDESDSTAYSETSTYLGPDGTSTYRATKFTINFEFAFREGSGITQAGLYFDGSSTCTGSGFAASTIKKALRIAFVADAKNYRVYAPEATEALNHVSGAAATTAYDAGHTTNGTTVEAFAESGNNYLGTFSKSDNTISVDVYTWIEGCDTSCVNGATLFTDLVTTLKFNAVNNTAK